MLKYVFLLFPENRFWYFVQIVSIWRQFARNIKACFLGKNIKKISSPAEIAQRVVKVNMAEMYSSHYLSNEVICLPLEFCVPEMWSVQTANLPTLYHTSSVGLDTLHLTTVLSTSFGKPFFYWAFYSRWKIWFVIDTILTETICRLCSCA